MKLNAAQMRTVEERHVQTEASQLKRNPIYFILENIYDTYNVGGLFRLADGLAVSTMYLCGQTETPPNSKIKKSSIGTYKVVPWMYKPTAKQAVEELKKEFPGIHIVAIEQDETSVPYTSIDYTFPVALLVGNETYGTLPETLKVMDTIAEIPMWGINKSLNVIVSAGIVSYHVAQKLEARI